MIATPSTTMVIAYGVIALVAAQRLAELWLSARNTRQLKNAGAVEHGRGHYPLFVTLHGGWLIAIAAGIGPSTLIGWGWLAAFALLQGVRVWVIRSLGRFWTTRIFSLDHAALVRRGPYRWLRHPNYLVVALELAILPLAFGLPWVALVASLANLPLTAWRIRCEDSALASRRAAMTAPPKTGEIR